MKQNVIQICDTYIRVYEIVELCNFAFFNERRNAFPYFHIITGIQDFNNCSYLNMLGLCE